MKLSARNAMPGKVVSVSRGATTAHVKIEVAPPATAVVKSSDVIVAVE